MSDDSPPEIAEAARRPTAWVRAAVITFLFGVLGFLLLQAGADLPVALAVVVLGPLLTLAHRPLLRAGTAAALAVAGRRNTSTPSDLSEPDPSGPARLGIIHLLVWGACVAVVFSVYRSGQLLLLRQYPMTGSDDPVTWETWAALWWIVTGIGSGAVVGGLVMLAARRLGGYRYPFHPGQWLWTMEGGYLGVHLLAYPVAILGIAHPLLRSVVEWTSVAAALAIWLWTFAGVRERPWRLLVLGLGLAKLGSFVLMIVAARALFPSGSARDWAYPAITSLPQLVHFAVIPLVLADRRAGFRRPWTHWAGVALLLWAGIGGLGSMVMEYLYLQAM